MPKIAKPARYGVVAIVKDAGASIDAMLASAIAAGVTVATIVDTGSRDDTMARVRAACAGIELRLSESPFVNFGAARSEAFALARGSADWLLALDADMTVEIAEGFDPDPAHHPTMHQGMSAYMIEMRDSGSSWRLPLLLRGDLPWRSVGAVHEYTTLGDGQAFVGVPTDAVRVIFPPTQSSPSKRHWQAGLLEEELERDPGNARSTFYLAQTYREIGDPRARETYIRRSLMDTSGEAWYAAYRAALLADWPGRAAELMAAWQRWPARLEPLHYLVRDLNRNGCHEAAYRLAVIPTEPMPDGLFMEPGVWDWGMAFERSIAAWWAGHENEARLLGEELLRRDLPDEIRAAVLRNLAFTEPVAA